MKIILTESQLKTAINERSIRYSEEEDRAQDQRCRNKIASREMACSRDQRERRIFSALCQVCFVGIRRRYP